MSERLNVPGRARLVDDASQGRPKDVQWLHA